MGDPALVPTGVKNVGSEAAYSTPVVASFLLTSENVLTSVLLVCKSASVAIIVQSLKPSG